MSVTDSTLSKVNWRLREIVFWVVYLFLTNTVGATSELMERARDGRSIAFFEPFLWEYSSAFCTLLLVPAVIYLERRQPFTATTWKKALAVHMAATIPYSLLHVAGMVGIRKFVYAAIGSSYDFGNVRVELFYEWRKDALTYFFILAVVYLYRLYRAKTEGAASFQDTPKNNQGNSVPDKFSVKLGGDTFFVPIADIDWIESAGNYVLLHCGNRNFMLRATMKSVEAQLSKLPFARVHRSAIVNGDKVASLRQSAVGDGVLTLASGHTVRMSRHYRNNLHEMIAQAKIQAPN